MVASMAVDGLVIVQVTADGACTKDVAPGFAEVAVMIFCGT
jgi:hypothetical protein